MDNYTTWVFPARPAFLNTSELCIYQEEFEKDFIKHAFSFFIYGLLEYHSNVILPWFQLVPRRPKFTLFIEGLMRILGC